MGGYDNHDFRLGEPCDPLYDYDQLCPPQIIATLVSCDFLGIMFDIFPIWDPIYVMGTGLEAVTDYALWIQSDPIVEGAPLSAGNDPSPIQEVIGTDPNGDFPPTLIWNNSNLSQNFDIVADKLYDGGNTGFYNSLSDVIDSSTTIGFMVLPSDIMVDIYVDLQGDNRPSPEGWEVPISVGFFEPGDDVMVDTPLYHFDGITTAVSSVSGTRAYFQCPDPINPGTYDITTDSTTTLLNVKRNVFIN